ncbi:MAG: TrmO family methyltransferase [Bacteroidales bacterium]|nr:TrmO family methyltransferase [Bacteroidales bacterium]
MEEKFTINAIGSVVIEKEKYSIRIKDNYKDALVNNDGFSHLQVIWWGHLCDNRESRTTLKMKNLFKNGPDEIGVFASHAPMRPNPILVSIISTGKIDHEKGIIHTPFIDA